MAWCFRRCNLQSWRWRAVCATTRLLFRGKTSRPRDLITVYRDLSSKTQHRCTWIDRSGDGDEGAGVVVGVAGVLLAMGLAILSGFSLTPKPGR